jgi:hypothetical protein
MSKAKGDRRERQSKEILEFADYTVETPNSTLTLKVMVLISLVVLTL